MEKSFSIPISRRAFMKLVGMGTVGVLAETAMPSGKAAAAPAGVNGEGLPTLLTADVCVVGGGAAGTAAAISAARAGAKVVLVERGISLGGLTTQGCVFPCMPTYAFDSDTPYIKELNKRIEKKAGFSPLPNVPETDTDYGEGMGLYAPELLTEIYDEWCEETGTTILYDAALVGAVVEAGTITACMVQTVEGLGKIQAKTFIDATGDALLSRFAGVPTEKGSDTNGRNQPMSLRFEMGGVDVPKVYHFFHDTLKDTWLEENWSKKFKEDVEKGREPYWEFAKWKKTENLFREAVKKGELTEDDVLYIQAFSIPGKPYTMSMNCPEMPPLMFSATDAVSRSKAVSFGRKMMRRLAAYFKGNIPGFEKAYISREASMVGVRESWRIRGKYYMEADDYLKARHFPDAVCRTAYPIDIHDVKLDLFEKLKKGQYYEIPYRALVTHELSNLLVVGRCASGSFAAQASFRIQPTCMSMGEAAGIAAAWGLSRNIPVNEVKWEDIPAEKRSYVSQ